MVFRFKPYINTVISEGFGKDLVLYFQSFKVDTDLLRMKLNLRARKNEHKPKFSNPEWE